MVLGGWVGDLGRREGTERCRNAIFNVCECIAAPALREEEIPRQGCTYMKCGATGLGARRTVASLGGWAMGYHLETTC